MTEENKVCPICLDDGFFPPKHNLYIYECLCPCHEKSFDKKFERNDTGYPKNRG